MITDEYNEDYVDYLEDWWLLDRLILLMLVALILGATLGIVLQTFNSHTITMTTLVDRPTL